MSEVVVVSDANNRVRELSPVSTTSAEEKHAKSPSVQPLSKQTIDTYVVQVIACGITYDVPVTENTRMASVLREVAELAIPLECSKALGTIQAVLFCDNHPLPSDIPMSAVPRGAILHLHIRLESFVSLSRSVSPNGVRKSNVFPYQNANCLSPYQSVSNSYVPVRGFNSVSVGGLTERESFSPSRDVVSERQHSPSWGTKGCTYVALQSTVDRGVSLSPTRSPVSPPFTSANRAVSSFPTDCDKQQKCSETQYVTLYVQLPQTNLNEDAHLDTLASQSLLQLDEIPAVSDELDSSFLSLHHGSVRRLRARQDLVVSSLRSLFSVPAEYTLFLEGQAAVDEQKTIKELSVLSHTLLVFARNTDEIEPLDKSLADSINKKKQKRPQVTRLDPINLSQLPTSSRTGTNSVVSPIINDGNTTIPFERANSVTSLRSDASDYSIRRRRSRASVEEEEVKPSEMPLIVSAHSADNTGTALPPLGSVNPNVDVLSVKRRNSGGSKVEFMQPLIQIPMFESPEGSTSPNTTSPTPFKNDGTGDTMQTNTADTTNDQLPSSITRGNSSRHFSNVQLSGNKSLSTEDDLKVSPIKAPDSSTVGLSSIQRQDSSDPVPLKSHAHQRTEREPHRKPVKPVLSIEEVSPPRLSSVEQTPKRSSLEVVSSKIRSVVPRVDSKAKKTLGSSKRTKPSASQPLPPIEAASVTTRRKSADGEVSNSSSNLKGFTPDHHEISGSRVLSPVFPTTAPVAATAAPPEGGTTTESFPHSENSSVIRMSDPGSLKAPFSPSPTKVTSSLKSSASKKDSNRKCDNANGPTYSFDEITTHSTTVNDPFEDQGSPKSEAQQRNSSETEVTEPSDSKIRITVRDPVDLAVFNYNVPVVPHCPVGILRQWLVEDLENRTDNEEIPPLLDERKYGIFYGHNSKYITDEEATFEDITKGAHDVLFQILKMNE